MALAAVAQALNTLVNVMPVSPTRRVTASGLEISWLPPKPNWMSFHSTPASVSANWMASAPICIASLVEPAERMQAHTDDGHIVGHLRLLLRLAGKRTS